MKRLSAALSLLILALVLHGCANEAEKENGVASNSATPAQGNSPQNVSAIPAPGEVKLDWMSVPGATSYTVYYGVTPNQSKASHQMVSSGWEVGGVMKNLSPTTYYFTVTAVTPEGESAESNVVSVVVPPLK